MRVALYSSKKERCGIATYTTHLEKALKELGAEVGHWASLVDDQRVFEEVDSWSPDVFHVQYEQAIMPPRDVLLRFTKGRADRGLKNAITLHSETEKLAEIGRERSFHIAIVHRSLRNLPGARIVPMSCPVRGVLPSKDELREKYGFGKDAFVLSTLGFLMPWKKTDEIVMRLLPWLKERPKVVLQVLASEHFNPAAQDYAGECRKRIAAMSQSVDGRINHVSDYPSDEELLERLVLSDLGYVFCPFHTASSSAAASLFVSAGCPLVISTSSHYEHMIGHAVQASMDDLDAFARVVMDAADDPALLLRLRSSQQTLYEKTNYLESARRHLKIYAGL